MAINDVFKNNTILFIKNLYESINAILKEKVFIINIS